MRDVKASLLPIETVQYQYAYPVWLKMLAGAGVVFFGYSLFIDLRSGQSCLITLDIILVAYLVYWLVLMLRDSGRYVVTDQRVLRLGSKPEEDRIIPYPQISGVRAWKDMLSGNGYVEVVTADGRSLRIPLVGFGRGKTEWLAKRIDQYRGGQKSGEADVPEAGVLEEGMVEADAPEKGGQEPAENEGDSTAKD